MDKVRLIVLDILKPHSPNILELAEKLESLPSVLGVDITLFEMDNKVENVKLTLVGDSLRYNEIQDVIRDSGATIHSMDKVKAGHIVVQEAETQQEEGANMNAPRRRR